MKSSKSRPPLSPYEMGRRAFETREACPFPETSESARDWGWGRYDAELAAEQRAKAQPAQPQIGGAP